MAGRGSLAGLMPYGDANGIVVEMAAEVFPSSKTHQCWRRLWHGSVSVVARLHQTLKEMGFTGVRISPPWD
jgi:predicted TIM-barrel enzyme